MKTMRKLFFSSLLLILYTGLISSAFASGKELQKTYTWKYNISKDGNVVIDNYDCNLSIHVWDKAEAEYHLIVDATTRTDEDATALDTYLQDLKFSSSSASVRFGNSFWETRNNIMGRMTMKLKGGKVVGLSEFTMKGELWVPSTCRFEVISKYSEINMEDFIGPLKLDLYNDNFYGAGVKGNTEITDKYSTIELKDMSDLKADLYNSKLEAGNTGILKIESKYSKVTTLSSGRLDIDSYNDKYNIPKAGDITFTAKYSDLKTEGAGKVNLDCYEGTVAIQVASDIKITSKYADFQFAKAENVTISSSYNDKLAAVKLNSLKINESKYCSFRIEELVNTVTEADGYEDKFNIMKTGQDFKGLNITGKYVNISLGLPTAVDFRFRAKIDYPKLEIDESKLTTKTKIKDGEHLEYDAVKGADKEGMPVIEVSGYQMALKIIGI